MIISFVSETQAMIITLHCKLETMVTKYLLVLEIMFFSFRHLREYQDTDTVLCQFLQLCMRNHDFYTVFWLKCFFLEKYNTHQPWLLLFCGQCQFGGAVQNLSSFSFKALNVAVAIATRNLFSSRHRATVSFHIF